MQFQSKFQQDFWDIANTHKTTLKFIQKTKTSKQTNKTNKPKIAKIF